MAKLLPMVNSTQAGPVPSAMSMMAQGGPQPLNIPSEVKMKKKRVPKAKKSRKK